MIAPPEFDPLREPERSYNMVYAISDLHGYPLEGLQDLLAKARFCGSDYLFVLGDVIDRNGDGGVEMLRWMMYQPNVELILGNHEAMMLACAFLFEDVSDESLERLTGDRLTALNLWLRNGGQVTIDSLRAICRTEQLKYILEYLRDAERFTTVGTAKRDFLLTHSGLGGFRPERRLSDYTDDELLWNRPKLEDRYFDDVITVFGHTPTKYYGTDGRILRTPTWIDIDTGAAGGDPPAMLRLDDLREYYA